MLTLDLKDAYLHVSFFSPNRKFMRFTLGDPKGSLHLYQWRVLPFGLAMGPQALCQDLGPYSSPSTPQSYVQCPYIDNIFHAQISKPSAALTRKKKTTNQCMTPSSAGFYNQPSQVFPCSFTGDNASRCLDRHLQRIVIVKMTPDKVWEVRMCLRVSWHMASFLQDTSRV